MDSIYEYIALIKESNQFHQLLHEISAFSAYNKHVLKKYLNQTVLEYNFVFEIDIYDVIVFFLICFVLFLLVKVMGALLFLMKNGFIKTISRLLFRLALKIPFVRKKVDKMIEKTQNSIRQELNAKSAPKTFRLPPTGMNEKTIAKRKAEWLSNDVPTLEERKISGAMYSEGSEYEEKLKDFTSLVFNSEDFIFFNPLHYDLFSSVRQMEAEIISMTGNLLSPNTHKDYYGVVTSGGTESIMCSILSYRNYALKERGITKPNL